MANRNRLTRQFPRNRRTPNRSWDGVVQSTFTSVGAAGKVFFASATLNNTNIDETILRIVGTLAVRSDQSAAVEDMLGAFGAIRVSERAATVGVTAVPGPITDVDDDGWMLYVPIVSSGANTVVPLSSLVIPFDSRSKRTIEEGQRIAFVVENASASHGFEFASIIRALSMVRGTG